MRQPYRILLWTVGGLLATGAVLVFTALIAIPRPTPEELATDSTVPTSSSGPGHGWHSASDGTRLYERVHRTAGPRRGIVLYVARITGLGGDEQPEFVAALVARGFEVRFLHPRGTGHSDGLRGDIADLDRYLEDYREYARAVAPEGTPVVVVGHSMGGVFALRIAASLPNTAGLVLINPAHRYAARCRCPLLLVDGDADRIVDRAGHAALLNAYVGTDKTRLTVPGGGHGYATVRQALRTIAEWVDARGR